MEPQKSATSAVTHLSSSQNMNELELIAALVQSLAWPLTVLVIIAFFRREVRTLITVVNERMRCLTSLKVAGNEFVFSAEVKAVLEQQGTVQIVSSAIALAGTQLLQLTIKNPQEAVREASKTLRQAAKELIKRAGYFERPTSPKIDDPKLVIDKVLYEEKFLTMDSMKIYSRLCSLADRMTAGTALSPSIEAANEYVQAVLKLMQTMETFYGSR